MSFYAVHSLLAFNSVKKWGEGVFGNARRYRLFYSLISSITLSVVVYLALILESQSLFYRTFVMIYSGLMIASLGILILQASFRHVSVKSFLGLQQDLQDQLNESGIHQYVRHPIYSGTVLIFIGAFLFNPTDTMLASVICLLLYLPFGIYWEEKKLIKTFGEGYLEYKSRVKAIIPWLI